MWLALLVTGAAARGPTLPGSREDNDDPQNVGRKFWTDQFVSKAIDQAAKILKKIDDRWPTET